MDQADESFESFDWTSHLDELGTGIVREDSGVYDRRVAVRFEDLRVWVTVHRVANNVYDLTSSTAFSGNCSLCDQMRRSAVSIGSNIAEGYERGSRSEFAQFLNYPKGSAGELRSQAHLAEARGFITQEQHQILTEDCILVSRQLVTMIRNLKQRISG